MHRLKRRIVAVVCGVCKGAAGRPCTCSGFCRRTGERRWHPCRACDFRGYRPRAMTARTEQKLRDQGRIWKGDMRDSRAFPTPAEWPGCHWDGGRA